MGQIILFEHLRVVYGQRLQRLPERQLLGVGDERQRLRTRGSCDRSAGERRAARREGGREEAQAVTAARLLPARRIPLPAPARAPAAAHGVKMHIVN